VTRFISRKQWLVRWNLAGRPRVVHDPALLVWAPPEAFDSVRERGGPGIGCDVVIGNPEITWHTVINHAGKTFPVEVMIRHLGKAYEGWSYLDDYGGTHPGLFKDGVAFLDLLKHFLSELKNSLRVTYADTLINTQLGAPWDEIPELVAFEEAVHLRWAHEGVGLTHLNLDDPILVQKDRLWGAASDAVGGGNPAGRTFEIRVIGEKETSK